MPRKAKMFEVYICSLNKEILYIGSGKINRHKHCNSGTSHVYDLNKLHFEGVIFDVDLKFFDTKEESLEEERSLIKKHVPKFNTVFTGKGSSRAYWMHNYDKLRKAFDKYNRFPEKSNMYNKMNSFLKLFLEAHEIQMIEYEGGVLLRSRLFYKVRGHDKICNLIKNHRCTAKGGTNVFITFFSILKLSLEETFNRNMKFAWFEDDRSFSEELLDVETLFWYDCDS